MNFKLFLQTCLFREKNTIMDNYHYFINININTNMGTLPTNRNMLFIPWVQKADHTPRRALELATGIRQF